MTKKRVKVFLLVLFAVYFGAVFLRGALRDRLAVVLATQASAVTRTTFVPSASKMARFPCATTTPDPPEVLNVVVNAPVLLQNTVPCHSFGTMTFLFPVKIPVVVR